MTTETFPATDPQPMPGAETPRRDDVLSGLEEIRGPVFGYHVAAYTLERPEGHYAFAKVCVGEPASVWETPTARAIVSAGPEADAARALEGVFRKVYRRLSVKRANLPTTPAELDEVPPAGDGKG